MAEKDFAVSVKLSADATQYTAEFKAAGQTAQAFAAQVESSSATATTAVQGAAAQAGTLGQATSAAAGQAAQALQATVPAAKAAGEAVRSAGGQAGAALQAATAQAGTLGQVASAAAGQAARSLQATAPAAEAIGAALQGTTNRASAAARSLQAVESAWFGVGRASAPAAAARLDDVLAGWGRSGGAAAAALAEVDGRTQQVGMSARATAAAMRNVPAQITDIVTSLQGGMPVMTVLTQQGGQLRDMFGGFVPALRALGSVVMSMVTPFTALAAVAGVAALAYYQGSREADGYRAALLMTGNAAGATVGQLSDMARAMSQVSGTQGAAAAALTQMAASGAVGAENLQRFAAVAMDLEKYVGTPVKNTVKDLEQLAQEPLKASVKLNEQYHYLTASVYEQIKALDEQGRKEEAAALAQRSYVDAFEARKNNMVANLGAIERGWAAVAGAAKRGWDAILNLGREETSAEKLEKVRAQIAEREKQIAADGFGETAGGAATGRPSRANTERLRAELAALQAQAAALEGVANQQRAAAEQEAKRAEGMEALARWDKEGAQFRSRQAKRDEEIRREEIEGEKLIAQGLITEHDLRQRIANIREKYKDPKGAGKISVSDGQVAALNAQLDAARAYYQQLAANSAQAETLNAGERESLRIAQQLKVATDAKTIAKLREMQATADALAVQLRTNEGLKASVAAHEAQIDANYKDANTLKERTLQQEAANAVYGKGRTAIEAMTLATLEHQLREAEGSDNFDPRYIASLREKIDWQKRWVESLKEGDAKVLQGRADELVRSARDMAAAYADELQLSGMTALQREKIVAQRQIELKYAKLIAEVNRSSLSDEKKEELRQDLRLAERVESEAAVAKVVQNDWAKTSDEINRSLTDALLRGFESGKSFADNFRATLYNMFNTLVLRPVISFILAPISGGVAGLLGMGGGGAGGGIGGTGPGVMDMLSMGKTIYSAITGGFQALSGQIAVQVQSGLNFLTGSGGMISQGPIQVGAFANGVGLAGSYLAGAGIGRMAGRFLSGGYSAFGSSGNTPINAGVIIGSIFGGPIGGAIGGAIGGLVNRVFGRKLKDTGLEGTFGGDSGFEGRYYQFYKGGVLRSNKTKYSELDEQTRKQLADTFTGLRDGIKEMGKVLGLGGEALDKFSQRVKVSLHGLSAEDAQKRLQEEFEKIGISMADLILGLPTTPQEAAGDRRFLFGVNPDAAATAAVDPEAEKRAEAFKQLQKAGESSLDTLTRLAGSLAVTNGVFETLGHNLYAASLQGGDMADKLVELFGGADKFTAATSDYFKRFYTGAEQREAMRRSIEKQLAAVDIKLPDINADNAREQYRKLVDAQDKNTEAGRKALAVLMQLAPLFDEIAISADTRRGLEERLLIAQGKDRAVVEMRRKQEHEALAKLDPSLAKLVEQIYMLEDAAAAAAQAQEITNKGRDLEQRLLIAQGKDRQALDLRRLQEYYALLKLDPALAALVIEIYKAEDAATAAAQAEEARRKVEEDRKAATDRAYAALEKSISAARDAAQAEVELRDARVAASKELVNLARAQARELRGQVESTAAMQAADGRAVIEQTLAALRSGQAVDDNNRISQAITAARGGIVTSSYSNRLDYEAAQLVLANKLDVMGDLGAAQLSTDELLLHAAKNEVERLDKLLQTQKDALDVARGQYVGLLDLGSAMRGFEAALAAESGKAPAPAAGSSGSTAGSASGSPSGGAVFGGTPSSGAAAAAMKTSRDPYGRVLYADGSKGPPVDTWFEGNTLRWAEKSPYNPANVGKGLPPLPEFAVGINRVPYDMDARIHAGEAVLPAKFNPFNPQAQMPWGAQDNGEIVRAVQSLERQQYDLLRAVLDKLGSVDATTRKLDALGIKQREVQAV